MSIKVKVLVIHNFLGVQGQPCTVPAAGEDLLPPVQRGQLLLEEDDPAFHQAQSALFGGGVVPTGGGQDGLGDLVGDALVLEFPDVCAQGAFASKRKNRELVLNRTGS